MKKKKKTGKCRTSVTVVHGNLGHVAANFSAVVVAQGLQKLSFSFFFLKISRFIWFISNCKPQQRL